MTINKDVISEVSRNIKENKLTNEDEVTDLVASTK